MPSKIEALNHIDSVLSTYRYQKDFTSFTALEIVEEVTVRSVAAIYRLSPPDGVYLQFLKSILSSNLEPYQRVDRICGILIALRKDIYGDCLISYRELIHAEVFADFLDMSAYLLSEEYKDAAAVMAGGVLEDHLRKLALKHDVVLEDDGKIKMIDRLNTDLYKQKIYSSLDHKQVTVWADIRNKSAHGKYSEYSIQQVDLMVQGLRNFVSRNPA